MAIIKVLVHGATGRMGREVISALCGALDMELVGGVSRQPVEGVLTLPDHSGVVVLSSDLPALLTDTRPQVVVDFSNAEACLAAATEVLGKGVPFVTGTTGLTEDDLYRLDSMAVENQVGVVVAPNFSVGAVLMMSLVRKAAPFFDYVDIIETHHEGKIDAPSGTAIALARVASEEKEFIHTQPEKETLTGTRGGEYNGVGIYSLRQAGRSAHHEVVLGTLGQTLTLRHDTLGRDCYMPGVLRAIRNVVKLKGLVLGLEKILGL